jgi:hypothetical protein
MIGAWDASRQGVPLSAPDRKRLSRTLEQDATDGHLFLIHTGGDCGGEVDVYLDEEIPKQVHTRVRVIEREVLLSVPSGKLTIGGAEDYRQSKPANLKIIGPDSTIDIPGGDYRLRCYVANQEEDEPGGLSISKLEENVLGPEDLAYYRRMNKKQVTAAFSGCLIFLIFLIFPLLAYPFGWKIALAATWAFGMAYYYLAWEPVRRRVAGDSRWQRLNRAVGKAHQGSQSPTFILELHSVDDRGGLKGGSVQVG